jgi:hypothetical protein
MARNSNAEGGGAGGSERAMSPEEGSAPARKNPTSAASGAAGEPGAKRAPARKAPAKKAPGKAPAKKSSGEGSGARKGAGKSPDLTRDLRDFASGRPNGWDHSDWESFLEHLRGRGHDTSNADAIGLSLERERLALALGKVEGVGPQRVRALADRFTTLWSLRNAEVEEIASAANIRRDLAERIKASV